MEWLKIALIRFAFRANLSTSAIHRRCAGDPLDQIVATGDLKRSLYKSAVRSVRRRKVECIDQAQNLCQMYVDFSYILVVFSYIEKFLSFGLILTA